MKGPLLLAWRHLLHHPGRHLILSMCLAVPIFLPVTTTLLIARYEGALADRAANTPLLAGAAGNRFDLTLASLWFRDNELATYPWSQLERLATMRLGTVIPVHARFKARGWPIIATSPEYAELRGLDAKRGTCPLQLGEVCLGASVATELGLGPGDALFSDQKELYDIAKPPALKMHVCGVLKATETPDDDAVFVDVKTAWILEGLVHGHDDVRKVDPSLVLGPLSPKKGGQGVAVSGALIEYNEVTPENAASFHYHGESSKLPLTSVIVAPRDAKSRTLIKARVNAEPLWQMVVPSDVVNDLLAFVFRIKALLDVFSGLLAVCTVLLMVLIVLLSMRIRRREMETLHSIGCSRDIVARIYGYEIALMAGAGILVAALATAGSLMFLPDLVRTL